VVVAGRWYFPAPSLALRVAALAFEVFRRRRAEPSPPRGGLGSYGPSGPWLPSRDLTCCPGRTLVRPPLVGFVGAGHAHRLSPPNLTRTPSPSTDPAERPLPQALPPASAPERPSLESCSVLVVSHHLDGFLRSEVAGLLHPAAGHGVRCVSHTPVPEPARTASRSLGGRRKCRPRSAFHTPRRIPRQQPHHVTVAVAPLPFATALARPSDARRCRRAPRSPTCAERRLRGVAPPPSPDTRPNVAARFRILSFPGLCSPSRSFAPPTAPRAVDRTVTRCQISEEDCISCDTLRSAPVTLRA
jgi:hypothetical protein